VLKRFDDGIARGEATLAGLFLLSMVAVAAVQVIVDNSAIRFHAEWAQDLKTHLVWIDDYLKRASVILAFLGASLAIRAHKHILIDTLIRLLPERIELVLRGISLVVTSIICYLLSRVFYQAAIGAAVNDARTHSLEVYLVGDVHLCDATPADLAAVELSRPDLLCVFRSFTAGLGLEHTVLRSGEEVTVPVIDVFSGILRFVVPVMLLLMAVRFLAHGIGTFMEIARGYGVGTRAKGAPEPPPPNPGVPEDVRTRTNAPSEPEDDAPEERASDEESASEEESASDEESASEEEPASDEESASEDDRSSEPGKPQGGAS
jgi:TRAP-type C4-dicarboxylate transport system permease small subunit